MGAAFRSILRYEKYGFDSAPRRTAIRRPTHPAVSLPAHTGTALPMGRFPLALKIRHPVRRLDREYGC
jgi:hypothetical protein